MRIKKLIYEEGMMNFKHYVITKFNIRARFSCKLRDSNYNPMLQILNHEYLEKRFEIFQNFTFNSMRKQTNQNFTWIILFHKRTPKKFLEKINELKKKYYFEDLYFDDDEKFDFTNYCAKNNDGFDFYISTRLDNDDCIEKDFIKSIQDYAEDNLHNCFISFVHGLKIDLNENKRYDYFRKSNQFISLIYSNYEMSVLDVVHSKIDDSGIEIISFKTDNPMWAEVCHDTNVFNEINKELINK